MCKTDTTQKSRYANARQTEFKQKALKEQIIFDPGKLISYWSTNQEDVFTIHENV